MSDISRRSFSSEFSAQELRWDSPSRVSASYLSDPQSETKSSEASHASYDLVNPELRPALKGIRQANISWETLPSRVKLRSSHRCLRRRLRS